MAEVINLLSSSSPPPAPLRSDSACNPVAATVLTQIFEDVDDFDDTGSIDFAIDRPSKKQRLTPELPKILTQGSKPSALGERTVQPVYELSSETSSVPELKFDANGELKSRPSGLCRTEAVDEILFTSSLPEGEHSANLKLSKPRPFEVFEDILDESCDIDVNVSRSGPTDDTQRQYSHRTANLLAVLSQEPVAGGRHRHHRSQTTALATMRSANTRSLPVDDIENSSSPAEAATKNVAKGSNKVDPAKAAERAAAKASRDAEKEAERERKKLERELRAQEKQKAADLAEANKSRTNKKDAVPEMIVDMASSLQGTSVGNQVDEYMKNLGAEVTYSDPELDLSDKAPEQMQYGNIITWRRKVKSAYNDEEGRWEPLSTSRVVPEQHVLIHLTAVELAAMLCIPKSAVTAEPIDEASMKSNLDKHVASIRHRFGSCVPIYLIEGLSGWLKKNANAKNRAYTAAVRSQMADADQFEAGNMRATQARHRKRKKPPTNTLDLSSVTPEVAEEVLLHLQLAHQPILIHHTTSPGTTASQISALTQHLATRPYRQAQLDFNLKSATFCMDGGQVRTGDDPRDTFVKMLQEIQRVTPSMAYGIVDKFGSVRKLVQGFDRHGNLLLEDVRKSVNKDGGWSDKRLGPMVSKRLFKVFMGRDPSATDGMS
ncbi:hypothetical protein PV08_09505 [Exophiala spinifera]|uniref:ERCC4 domain-containing protein n=1 Tax=Exophiala spinifera TaxID=91928 RepID=A0A0D2BM12_9EURO|nr:uncharacterized protein PV08_09505 [Exophiala spinifera]KIW12229.1 hypothetical protein PV08_09505 [Exophiala spinifera]